MDWPTLIDKLVKSGWTQKRLAEKCGCAQATISDLARGKTADPSYPVGKELERLANDLAQPAPAPAPQAA